MMPVSPPFALVAYLSDKFPLLTLGGGLFYRWPIGIRFELGLELCRERAPRLYEAVFSREDSCVIVAQDWPHDLPPAARQRYRRVFSLPGAFDSNHPLPSKVWKLTRKTRTRTSPCNGDNCQRMAFATALLWKGSLTLTTPGRHQYHRASISLIRQQT